MTKSPIICIPRKSKRSGFTLLEVLITLVILSIGLLGLAGLQAVGLSQNHSAYLRSQATQAAYSIADRMRANQVASANYLSSFMLPSAATAQAGCTAGGCTAAQMATNDLFEWNTALSSSLPNIAVPVELGNITLNGAVFTITINWDDNRDGAIDNADPNFQLSFQP
jgi:type IV pilus assembly protein PilV